MKRCPECFRFDVEYDPKIKTYRCLWKDCGWINKNNIDLDKEEYKCNFSKFARYLEIRYLEIKKHAHT